MVSTSPTSTDRPHRRPPGATVHPTQVRAAFDLTGDRPARPAVVTAVAGDRVELQLLSGGTATVHVGDVDRLERTVLRRDLCRHDGLPLALVNTDVGVLGIATGPAQAPARLEVLLVSVMDHGSVVELLNDGDQPGWQLFGLSTATDTVAG
jgi:hypothetical protein